MVHQVVFVIALLDTYVQNAQLARKPVDVGLTAGDANIGRVEVRHVCREPLYGISIWVHRNEDHLRTRARLFFLQGIYPSERVCSRW